MKGNQIPFGPIPTRTTTSSAILLPLFLTAVVSSYHATPVLPEGTFPVAKRLDIETCLVRFDVHPNTIIRTEESRSMGACFLDDADLNSREQCLRLCCETENCDVFVFEEKSPGTCFLFQCGPPENFRCKFTHHSNYTSAVLSIPPLPLLEQPPPLAVQIQSLSAQQQANSAKNHLSQHEMELVNLKEGGNGKQLGMAGASFGSTTTTPLPPLGVRLGGDTQPTTSVITPKQQLAVPQCGHFEFPCHSGECIAVYNVCDGIPQCEDGSDEGPDCPQKNSGSVLSGGTLGQSVVMMPPGSRDLSGLENNQPIGGIGGSKILLPMYQPLEYQQAPNRFIIGSEQQQQQEQLSKPIIMHRNREDPMTDPKPWPRSSVNEPNYVDSTNSRIFNHKGGLQLSAAKNMGPLASQQYQESLPESNYMPSSTVVRVGGQPNPSLADSSLYPQRTPQQIPPEQQQSQYNSAISPQQWVGGNPMRLNWQPLSTSDHLSGIGMASPREQYIQPPVQQRRPTTVLQEMHPSPNVASNVEIPLRTPLQQKSFATQTQRPNGQQWPSEEKLQKENVIPAPDPTQRGSSAGESTSSGVESLTKDVTNRIGQLSIPIVGENPSKSKHKSATAIGDSHDDGAEYEQDAYEEIYPDSTNAADGTSGGAEAEEPTQTEPPKKKNRKHHKHDHENGLKDPNSLTLDAQADEKQKKKKKTKTTKKDKALDHHQGSLSDSIVHEHLRAELHKDLEIEFIDHDGYADRPGGAMLSLTLGVLLTAAMGILLSCRMRVARRRIRRPGKSSYAHDADFLVNGMYL